MTAAWSIEMFKYLTAVELPLLGGMFWFFWRARRDGDAALNDHRQRINRTIDHIRDRVSADKLDVAKNYASSESLKDVERRLTRHLLRIEAKLDRIFISRADRA
jgi:hypothetical protein